MEILAVIGIIAAFALVCVAIYWVGRSLQRKGHDLNCVDPRYPDSMQAVPGNREVTPPFAISVLAPRLKGCTA
jgi:hypothetical protein